MKHPFVIAVAAMAWALLGLQIEARGQPSRSTGGVVDVEFPGGNALEYIEALRAAGNDVNIVVYSPETVASVRMTAVTLASVDLSAALELLDGRKGQRPDDRKVKLKVLLVRGNSNRGIPLYRVTYNFYDSETDDSVVEISGVWTVADLLASQMESSDILTAIETALALFTDRPKPPEMRFHEPTGLLIARGEEEQLEVIDNIIDELRKTIDLRRDAAEFSIDGFIDLALPSLREFEEALREFGTATSVEKLGFAMLGTDDFVSKGEQVKRERERLFDRLKERMDNVERLMAEAVGQEKVDKAIAKRKAK
ncbi:MAG: hypothetical protein IID37_00360 [Planctomycetes bacterium]|nr:hypothetical protein [Planctomycetota bacterium]